MSNTLRYALMIPVGLFVAVCGIVTDDARLACIGGAIVGAALVAVDRELKARAALESCRAKEER